MSVYGRLGYSFDTTRFGSAAVLSDAAANTLTLIADNTPSIPDWQKSDLAAGNITRTNYFKNPTVQYLTPMLASTQSLADSANNVGDVDTATAATHLIMEINAFKSHTDNIAGVVTVNSSDVPGYDSASSVGQQMMTIISKTDGANTITDTTPILGNFTSLYIQDELRANASLIQTYNNEYVSSIISTTTNDGEGGTTTTYSSSLGANVLSTIISYLNETQQNLNLRRMSDWYFFRNSMQVMTEYGYLQQFSQMGNTNTNMVTNVVGTPSLIQKLASANT